MEILWSKWKPSTGNWKALLLILGGSCVQWVTQWLYLSKTKQSQHTLPNSIKSEHSSYLYTYTEYAMLEEATVILDKWLEENTRIFLRLHMLVFLQHSDRKMYQSAPHEFLLNRWENDKTHMSQTTHSACHTIHCYNLKKYAQDNSSHTHTPFWLNISKTIKT
jgi:hypothetical protein